MVRWILLLTVSVFLLPRPVLGQDGTATIFEILHECGCLASDMPRDLLNTRSVDHLGAQARWRLPVVIEALQDVVVQRPDPRHTDQSKRRSVLDGPNLEPITIKKGKQFSMVEILEEGGCAIEFEGRQYELSSCWWLDGFRDHREDFFKVLTAQ